jgi:tRNA dimethylallyltransferase
LKKTLIVIGGPTASGKTGLAIKVAQLLQTEIISADSRQCYKELNIGVAKQTEEELSLARHYFVNSHSVQEKVDVAVFEKYALDKLETIFSKNDYAVCCGGTGLYLKAICDGIDLMPSVNPEIQSVINQKYNEEGMEWLSYAIKENDAKYAEHGEMQNPARMLRAMIFYLSTGKSILEFRTKKKVERPFDIIKYCIAIEREELYENINKRVDRMMENGLLDEVKTISQFRQLNSLKTVGYTELFDYLDGKSSLGEAIALIKQNSRRYAKRQLTWFRNIGDYKFLSAEEIIKSIDAITNKK